MKRSVAILTFLILFLPACGKETRTATAPKGEDIKQLDLSLPPEIEGLKVQKEDISGALERVNPSYVSETALYSLRSGDELVQATLQVNRFVDDQTLPSNFRQRVVAQLGGTPAIPTRMGDRTIWRASGSNQTLALWFRGKAMYVLSIRNDMERPRTLIRHLSNLLTEST